MLARLVVIGVALGAVGVATADTATPITGQTVLLAKAHSGQWLQARREP
jgi:hypothetical protein